MGILELKRQRLMNSQFYLGQLTFNTHVSICAIPFKYNCAHKADCLIIKCPLFMLLVSFLNFDINTFQNSVNKMPSPGGLAFVDRLCCGHLISEAKTFSYSPQEICKHFCFHIYKMYLYIISQILETKNMFWESIMYTFSHIFFHFELSISTYHRLVVFVCH